MSLEAALAEHTAALKENTEQLKLSNAGRAEAIAAATALQAGGDAKPRAGRPPKDTTKNDAKADAKTDEAPKVLSAEDLRAVASEFMSLDPEKHGELLAQRKDFVKAIATHFGTTIIGVPEDSRAAVAAWIAVKTKDINAKVSFSGEEDAPAPAEDDLLG